MRALCPGPSQTSQTSLLGHSQGAPRATGRHQARTCMLAPRKPESGAGQHVPRSCSPLQRTAQNFSGFFGTRRNGRAVASPSPATLPSALRTSTAGQVLLRACARHPHTAPAPPTPGASPKGTSERERRQAYSPTWGRFTGLATCLLQGTQQARQRGAARAPSRLPVAAPSTGWRRLRPPTLHVTGDVCTASDPRHPCSASRRCPCAGDRPPARASGAQAALAARREQSTRPLVQFLGTLGSTLGLSSPLRPDDVRSLLWRRGRRLY